MFPFSTQQSNSMSFNEQEPGFHDPQFDLSYGIGIPHFNPDPDPMFAPQSNFCFDLKLNQNPHPTPSIQSQSSLDVQLNQSPHPTPSMQFQPNLDVQLNQSPHPNSNMQFQPPVGIDTKKFTGLKDIKSGTGKLRPREIPIFRPVSGTRIGNLEVSRKPAISTANKRACHRCKARYSMHNLRVCGAVDCYGDRVCSICFCHRCLGLFGLDSTTLTPHEVADFVCQRCTQKCDCSKCTENDKYTKMQRQANFHVPSSENPYKIRGKMITRLYKKKRRQADKSICPRKKQKLAPEIKTPKKTAAELAALVVGRLSLPRDSMDISNAVKRDRIVPVTESDLHAAITAHEDLKARHYARDVERAFIQEQIDELNTRLEAAPSLSDELAASESNLENMMDRFGVSV
jgi:hypothetical protein